MAYQLAYAIERQSTEARKDPKTLANLIVNHPSLSHWKVQVGEAMDFRDMEKPIEKASSNQDPQP